MNPLKHLSRTGKRLLFALALLIGCAFAVTFLPSCSTPPSQRVVAGQTLKVSGQTAEALVVFSAQLYRDGKLSATDARRIADFYDTKFQPAYRIAVIAAKTDLQSPAPDDVLALLAQLQTLFPSTK